MDVRAALVEYATVSGVEPEVTETATARQARWVYLAVLAVILVIGFALRTYRLDDECMWVDESVSYPYLHLPTLSAFLSEVPVHDPVMSPLYFTLEYYWARVAGDSIIAVRWLSILFGLASIALIYALGTLIYNRRAGLIAALCTALAIPHVYYSQEIRTYALVLCLSLASMYTFVRLLRDSQRVWWVLHVIGNALLLATHLFGVLVIFVQGVHLLALYGRRWRLWGAWGAAQALLLIPFLIRVNHLRGDALDHAIAQIPVPSLRWLLNTYCVYYVGVEPWGGRLPSGYWLVAPVVTLIVLSFLWSWFEDLHGRKVKPVRLNVFVLLMLWYVLPPLALYLLSFAVTPCFVEPYTLYSSFALFLMLGGVLSAVRRPWWTAFVLCTITAGYAWAWYDVARPFRLDYRNAAVLLDGTSRPGEPIVGWKEVGSTLLDPYSRVPFDDRFVHTDSVKEILQKVEELAGRGESCWVVVYDGPAGDPRPDLESQLRRREFRYHRTEIGGLRTLYVYHITRG